MRKVPCAPSRLRPSRRWLLLLMVALAATAASAGTITVDTSVDDDLADGECSLREAILAANTDAPRNDCPAGSGPDRIVFTLAKGETIALASALPTITETLLVRGPGADLLTIDGQDLHKILNFDPPAHGSWLGVEELTLTRGFAAYGAAAELASGQSAFFRRTIFLANRASASGGALAISSSGASGATVEVSECWFNLNQSLGSGGGGAIQVLDDGVDLFVDRTTFSGNVAGGANGDGGALLVQRARVRLERSTLSANEATDSGGAIALHTGSTPAVLALRDTTVTANRANTDGNASGAGGGIHATVGANQLTTVELHNSIVAANLDLGPNASPDAFLLAVGQLTVTSSGFNLIGSNAGSVSTLVAGSPNPDGDYVGSAASPIAPELNPLADYGGFAPDHRPAIVAGTPLIDKGFCTGSASDQRGYGDAVNHLRIVDTAFANGPGSDGCDIGAHERAGDPGADPEIFSDGFEWGHTLRWTNETT